MQRYFVLIFIFLLLVCRTGAQIVNPGFIRQTEPFEFNFPQFGVGLSLPANAGFTVPVFSGKEVLLDIDKKTNYCFNIGYLDNDATNTFGFSLPGGNGSQYLKLRITGQNGFNKIKKIENIRHKDNYTGMLKSVKSGLGESVSYEIKKGDNLTDCHIFYNDGYLFEFSIPSDIADKNSYLKIIKDFGKKNLYNERIRYENRVNFGYYDKDRAKPAELPPCLKEPDFGKIGGRVMANTTLDFPQLNMSMLIPEGWFYELNGRRLNEGNSNSLVLEMNEMDLLDNPMIFAWIRGEGLSVVARYSSKKHKNAVNYNSLSNGVKQVYAFWGNTEVFIDGIKAGGGYYGDPGSQNLDMYLETESGYYSFSASNITTDNIAAYDRFFSNIRIDSQTPRDKKALNNKQPVSSVLNVKRKINISLDNLEFPKKAKAQSFECKYSTIGATVFLPGKVSDYKYGINRTFGEIPLKLDENSAIGVAPDYENLFVYLYNEGCEYNVSCSLYLRYGDKSTIGDFVKDIVRSRPSIKTWSEIDKAGVMKADDGSEWGVLVQDDEKTAWIYGLNNKYLLNINITASNRDALMNICSLIYKFKMQNVGE